MDVSRVVYLKILALHHQRCLTTFTCAHITLNSTSATSGILRISQAQSTWSPISCSIIDVAVTLVVNGPIFIIQYTQPNS